MKRRGQQGYVLFTVVVMLVVVAVAALLVSYESSLKASMPAGEAEASRADYVAEAAMQHALWRSANNVCMGDVTIPTTTLGADSYSATVTGAAAGTFYSLTVDQDTWIGSASETVNYGGNKELHIDFETGDVSHALIRFNLSSLPAGAQINSATAWFRITGSGEHPEGPITVHRVTADWTEGDATWENMNGNFDSSILATIPAQPTVGVWVQVNLTAQVQSWVNGQSNYGILLASTAKGVRARYVTKENLASIRPYIEVVAGSGPASPVTINATGTLANGNTRSLTRLANSAYQPPVTVTLQLGTDPGADAVLDDFYPRNYGGADFVELSEDTGNWLERPVFRFDLGGVPAQAAVLSAQLELGLRSLNTPGTATVHRITRSWVEGTKSGTGTADGATWATYDGTNAWTTPGGDFNAAAVAVTAINGGETWVSWEIGPLVEQWLAGEPNDGLLIKGDATLRQAEFYSKEEADPTLRPKLTITYTCECGSACMAPQGSGNILMVVAEAASLSPGDQTTKSILESWGYTVNLISDDVNQNSFDVEMPLNDVIYVSESIDAIALSSKLDAAPIGIVSADAELNNQLGISSAKGTPVGHTLDVVETSHYITQVFPAGQLLFKTVDTELASTSGSKSPDAQVLATIGGQDSLVALETGGISTKGGTVTSRRVLLPVGNSDVSWGYLTNSGQLVAQRSLAWAMNADAAASSGALLLVVGNAGSPAAKDANRKTLFESWGYTVTLIDDGADQLKFDSEMAANDVVFVTDTVSGPTLLDKVTNTTTPVVNERGSKLGNFGFSSIESGTLTAAAFTGTDALHYISEPFGGNPVTVLSSSLSMAVPSGTLAPDLQNVGEIDSFGTGVLPVLAALDAGATRYDGNPSPGRRVHLPFGAADTSQMTADGKTILQRALEWAGGAGTAASPGYNVLLIVGNDTTLASKDVGYKALMESWGHTVAVLDDRASQTDYDTAMAAADVIYASGSALGAYMLDKATYTTKGMVNEVNGKIDNFGFSSSTSATTNFDAFSTTNAAHYITEPFTGSAVTVFASSLTNPIPGGTLAPDLQTVGEVSGTPSLVTLDAGATGWNGNPVPGRRAHLPFTSAETTDMTADGQTILQRALEWAATPPPATCDADYTPDTKLSEFSTSAYGSNNIQGVTYLPEGRSFNGIPVPAGGAWVSINYSDGKLFMTDLSGTYLTELSSPSGAPTGVTYVASGTWADHLALIDQSVGEVQYVDLTGTLVSSFSTLAYPSVVPTDVAFIGATTSGTYDDHLAIVDSNVDMVYLVTQNGGVASSFDTSAFSSKSNGIVHLPGSDKFLLVDWSAIAYIVDFDGNVLRQYDSDPFGTTAPEAITINPLTCDHVVGDDTPDLVVTLGQSGGGGGGGGGACNGTYLDQFEVYQFDNSDGTLDWSTSPWQEVGESDGPTAGDIRIWSDLNSGRIRTRDNDNGGEGLEREADLSGAAAATLSYDYRRDRLDSSSDYTTVEVSANGATGPWTELARYAGPDNDSAYTTASHDIGAYIGANTRVRFKTSSSMGGLDEVWFDNIEIACTP